MNTRDTKIRKNPIIGITIGDVNGIGPEVIIKTFLDNRIHKSFTPLIYCNPSVLTHYIKIYNIKNFNFNQISSHDKLAHNKVNVMSISSENIEVTPGIPTENSGKLAMKSLLVAVNDLKFNKIDAVVTAPISKDNIQSDSFNFKGHTEYFANAFNVPEPLMLMVSDDLKIGLVTGHIPLKDVSKTVTSDLILKKIKVLAEGLKKDFKIVKPKIALLGLNPHSGENGLLGSEEKNIIEPLIQGLKNESNFMVFGPYPADGFFAAGTYKAFDAVLAMYHDQGLIPFKYIASNSGVNFTLGLPIVRTSPAHGTAFSLAGKDLADPQSFRSAIYLAYEIYKKRNVDILND